MSTINETGFGSLDDDLERNAKAIFDSRIVSTLSPADIGKYLVIDTRTGEWEMDTNEYQASLRAYNKNPGARSRYGVKIGHQAVYNIWQLRNESPKGGTS